MGDEVLMHASIAANTTGTIRRLEGMATRAGLTEPAMEEIVDFIQKRERELFQSAGASAGRPWSPREASTEKGVKTGESSDVMVRTGALEDSLTQRHDQNAIREIGPGWLRFGTRLGYADPHFTGFKDRHGTRVPARRPIDLNRVDRYAIGKIMLNYLMDRSRLSPGISVRNRGGGVPG